MQHQLQKWLEKCSVMSFTTGAEHGLNGLSHANKISC